MSRAAYSAAELAQRWGVSLGHVYNMLRSRKLLGFKVGKDWRISADEVDRIEGRAVSVPVGNGSAGFTNPWDSP